MNRIYQGRVSSVEVLKPETKNEWEPLPGWQDALWHHHELFQDAVNYYIVALASLGVSRESKLTKLRELLAKVWDVADKKGQLRRGMRESLQRAWQLDQPPALNEAVEKFRQPLKASLVTPVEMELAGESVALDLGGEGSIQQGGAEYWPYYCQSGFKRGVTFPREAAQLAKEKAALQVPRLVWHPRSEANVQRIHRVLRQAHFCNVYPSKEVLPEEKAQELFFHALNVLLASGRINNDQKSCLARVQKSKALKIAAYAGGSINKDALKERFYGFLVFKHLAPDIEGLRILRSIYATPDDKVSRKKKDPTDKDRLEVRLRSLGDDPIKAVRDKAQIVFRAFTALPSWKNKGMPMELHERSAFRHEIIKEELHQILWKEFDVAAFKEALKVYNQFQQNVRKRDEKLDGFAIKLLVMDGLRAMEGYASDAEVDRKLRVRLERVWDKTDGKPMLPAKDDGEAIAVPKFIDDPRIDRLRQIINADLAEEYRLTDGRLTPYGLRRRTMKGWTEVKRRWQAIARKNTDFSEEIQSKLKTELDDLRSGEKREQIGSHKLFEGLLADDAAWSIWREPDDNLQEQINLKGWAADPLEAFREYCETREAFEEISARPLNFTPADARFSRRLFMFTDACSFGKAGGNYRHDAKHLAVTVPVAVCERDGTGRFVVQPCRLVYSAPRLLRDRIRAEDGTYVQDWTQPMMRALFGVTEAAANPQDLRDAAVQLMPDFDGAGNLRILLNFPLSLEPEPCWEQVYALRQQQVLFAARYGRKDKKQEKPLNGGIWESNLRTFWEGDTPKSRDFLYWPDDERKPQVWSKGYWWEKLSSIRALAADLGTRHAASIGLIEASRVGGGTARFIGRAGAHDWYARYRTGTILRLPGENTQVLRPRTRLDKDKRGKAFREELYGERGRKANEKECLETIRSLAALGQAELLHGLSDTTALQQRFSFPEQNDKLLVAMRRAQNWIALCVSWHWKLTKPDDEKQRGAALAQILECDRKPEWKELADGNLENLTALRNALRDQILQQRKLVEDGLLQLTKRILPLRGGRTWEWITHPVKSDCHFLRQIQKGSSSEKVKLAGQRGLSIARIEQLSELRRRWQSLNQSLRRELGQKPLMASEMRNDPIPDPCPDILRKLENIREQRVNQTAHLILAQAMGLILKEPEMSPESRRATDTHGEYVAVRPPVDMIVLEDLSRYLSDQGRARSENTRLMRWCHRAIVQKLKLLAEPFGIPVLETPAAYSSRFCSLTGAAGFRAAEVGWKDRSEFRWRVLLGEAAKARETGKSPSESAIYAVKLFNELEKISRSDRPHLTLLAPQPGGPMFITAQVVPHPGPVAGQKQTSHPSVLPMQADINAAVNLALRAIAHPGCISIHHRLRTERKKGAKNRPNIILTREPRRFGKEKVVIHLRPGDTVPKERNTNFFHDEFGFAQSGRERLGTDEASTHPYASGPGLWRIVNDREAQWRRCHEINAARLARWRREADVPGHPES